MKSPVLRALCPMLFLAGTVALHAAQFGDFTYESSGTEITITKYTGPGGDVTIPITINGLPVISIGGALTGWGNGAFSHCTSLTGVTVPDSVTNIGDFAFGWCTSLRSITIPDRVTSIGEGAFICCGMTSVKIGSGVTTIGDHAFRSCDNLTRIFIPGSVIRLGKSAFDESDNLSSLDVDLANAAYSSLEGVLFNKARTVLIKCPLRKSGSYTIPDTVRAIGEYAFELCTDLTSVTIPNSVTSIGGDAFFKCWRRASQCYYC